MWIEKLECGVLRVMTPLGPRYIQPSFWERVYLVWMFRHFATLPQVVLSRRQQRWIDRLCTEQGFVSAPGAWGEVPILGTIERRPVVEKFTVRGSTVEAANSVALAADTRQRP